MELRIDQTLFQPGRVFCIGRNYVEHIRELNNELPQKPVIFMKPGTCLVPPGSDVSKPRHGIELHHETEIVVLIGKRGRATTSQEARSFIAGLTIGLDLTLRDVQNELKKKGLPWELAKAFEQSAPIGLFKPYDGSFRLDDISFSASVNGEVRQQGNSNLMIFSIERLVTELSTIWELRPGDLIFTGTPAGVGPLEPGDTITITSDQFGSFSWHIV